MVFLNTGCPWIKAPIFVFLQNPFKVVNFRKMITIWKLTISTFRLGIPKFSKISFTIIVHRIAVSKLHKSGKSNVEIAKRLDMNCSTVWKIVKKFQETGNTLDWSGSGRKRSVRSPHLLKNTREKLRRNSCRSCRTFATVACVSKSAMHQVLRTIWRLSPSRYCIARSLRPIMWPRVVSVSWNFFTIFYTVFLSHKIHIQPFCNFNITFSTFVKLNCCISVYSPCKINFWKFWYT